MFLWRWASCVPTRECVEGSSHTSQSSTPQQSVCVSFSTAVAAAQCPQHLSQDMLE